MATFNQRDVQELFIGADATKTTGGIESLNVGEIGLFTPSGTRLTEASAATEARFIMVTNRSSEVSEPVLMSSSVVKGDLVAANCKRTLWVDTAEQDDFVGYNGTSGSIEEINDNLYHIRVNLNQSCTSNHGGMYVKHGIYESDASATQEEIAQGLTESLINDFSKETDKQLRAFRLNSDAGAVITGTGNLTFTGGSKYVSCSTAADAVFVVGDYVRVGVATADAIYKITAIDTTNEILTLDVPFQSVDGLASSQTVLEASAQVVVEADAQAGDFGVRLIGIALPYRTGKINFAVAGWTTTLENMGSTGLESNGAVPGTGNTNQMKDLEFFVQGNEGDYIRMGEPNLYPQRADVQTGVDYHVIDLTTEELYTGSITTGPIRKTFTVALPAANATDTSANYALAATADDITDVLEVLTFGAAGGEFAMG